jgi:hypothetical protein
VADVSEPTVLPKVVFERARTAYPSVRGKLDDAEWQLGGADAMLDYYFRPALPEPFRAGVECLTFSGRVTFIYVLAFERATQLAEGLASEIENGRLFPAATIARALMEMVGLVASATDKLRHLRAADPLDVRALSRETALLLLSNGNLVPEHYPTRKIGKLIAAAERRSPGFKETYGYLCDLTHPNALAALGAEFTEGSNLSIVRRPPITPENADLLVTAIVLGLHSISKEAATTIDWSRENEADLVVL